MDRADRTRERLVGVALLGALALNFPFLHLFGGGTVLGIPVLYLYLFVVWVALIVSVGLIIHARTADHRTASGETKGDTRRA